MNARDLARAVQSGAQSPRALAEARLALIAAEPWMQAWVALCDPQRVPLQAHGPLAGVPLGVKDVFDTDDLPTQHGSAVYAGHFAGRDAAPVALARRAGAVVLGKTATTEFATRSPAATCHPLRRDHTPGGSSSGSAAALARGHCLLALGTQTSGSTIRPAAFCGVVGMKPSRGVIDRTGVKALADSLDVVGPMAREMGDLTLLLATLARDPHLDLTRGDLPARIGLFLPRQEGASLSAGSLAALDGLARRLGAQTIRQPDWWQALGPAQEDVFAWEAAAALAYEREARAAELTEITRAFTAEQAERADRGAWRAGLALRDQALAGIEALFQGTDLLLTPAAAGPAPQGLGQTGAVDFNIRWSLLGLPSLTLPVGLEQGLPLGVQLVARPGADGALVSAALAIEAQITAADFYPAPGQERAACL